MRAICFLLDRLASGLGCDEDDGPVSIEGRQLRPWTAQNGNPVVSCHSRDLTLLLLLPQCTKDVQAPFVKRRLESLDADKYSHARRFSFLPYLLFSAFGSLVTLYFPLVCHSLCISSYRRY